jgi:competence protein ComEC
VAQRRGGRATTWLPQARRRAAAASWFWAELAERFRARFFGCLAVETAPGRLIPWLPVAFAGGILLYFAADQEPAWWAGLVAAGVSGIATFALRARFAGFAVAVALTAVAAGFAVATLRSHAISHPVLSAPVSGAQMSGYVEAKEERERSDRITLRVYHIEASRLEVRPERVRLSVRKGTAPAVGSFVALRARLNPPLPPLRPGSYDFARDMYFQNIGASGFVLGKIRYVTPPEPPGLRLRYVIAIDGLRDAIDARIRAVLQGDNGAIASALITGKRDAISTQTNDAMFISGLGHVLSISGYHMAVVAGVVFFTIRATLALVPAFATRYPIKKWAAGAALAMAAFYLLLSGAEVATRRAFIMTAIVLIGVMCDRPALTLRTIAVAAFCVLLVAPEAVVHPSFQMSFAATLALIAVYERGLPWFSAVAETPRAARIALWGGREIVGLIVASLVAGLATTLFAAYHFHRLAPYGILANLLAMPIVSAWVMPLGLLGVVALPFGFDGVFWRLMSGGIDWMTTVAQWVARLPCAVGHVSAFGVTPLLVASFGLIAICLLRSPLRFAGAVLIALSVMAMWRTPRPDVLVAADARMVAVRNPDGRLSVMAAMRDDFTLRAWLAADADARGARDETLLQHVRCDELGCTAQLAGGGLVAFSRSAEALIEDCARAVLVVTQRTVPPDCKAQVIDRTLWQRHGAAALTRVQDASAIKASERDTPERNAFTVVYTRPPGHSRPWAAQPLPRAESASLPGARQPLRDATPRNEDLEADD